MMGSKLFRKVMAYLLVLTMVVTIMPGTIVKADSEDDGKIRVTCQSEINGKLFYKLAGESSFTECTVTAGSFAKISLGSQTSISFKFVPDSGYVLDSGRGISLRTQPGDTLVEKKGSEAVAQAVSDAGISFDLQGEANSSKQFELEFGFMSESTPPGPGGDGGGNNGQGGNDLNVTVKLGDTELIKNGVIQEGNLPEGIRFEENQRRCWDIILTGLNAADKNLIIDGDCNIGIKVESGTTTLNQIVLSDGTRIDGDCNRTSDEQPTLKLVQGFKHNGDKDKNTQICLSNDIDLQIGTSEAPATVAFEKIKVVTFRNYEFHSREKINNKIYATTAFKTVDEVHFLYTKAEITASKLFDKGDHGDGFKTTSSVMSEAQVTFKGAELGDVKLMSNYYASYPTGKIERNRVNDDCNAIDYYTEVEIPSSETLTATDKGCTYTVEGTGADTVRKWVSTDVILFAISYVIDDGIQEQYPNPEQGEIIMDGFKKGFYTEEDGKFAAWIAAGETVNVTILPAAGYQYKKNTLNINGQVIDSGTSAGEAKGSYSFTMPANAGHVCAAFVKTDDIVSVTDKNIDSAKVSNTEGAVDTGNVKLEVAKEDPKAEDTAKIQAAAGTATVAEVLDIDLSESVVKNYDASAATNESWDTPITELDKPVTIEVTLGKEIAGAEGYSIVREHDGKAEVIKSNYDEKSNSISFETDKFSTYAICKSQCTHKKTAMKNAKKATPTAEGKQADKVCETCGAVLETGAVIKCPNMVVVDTANYTGKALKPAVKVYDTEDKEIPASNYDLEYKNNKNPGNATVTVNFKGDLYEGQMVQRFKVTVELPTISKLKNNKSKVATVTWKKLKTSGGIQIKYTVGKKSKTVTVKGNKKTSYTIKKLTKGKKYKVCIRNYVTINKKNYYSSWTKKKSVTIKK